MKNLGFLGYPDYAVTKQGCVFSALSNRFLKPSLSNTSGARRVNLRYNGKVKTIEVHTLVAKAFLPNPDNLLVVNHKDGDRSNNNLSNLEWCTYEYNSNHAVQTGLSKVRSLDELLVHKILSMMEEGYTNKDISEALGVNYPVIGKIRQGANYRDLWEQYSIPSKKHTVSISTVVRIKEMLSEDKYISDICKVLKVSRNLVKDIRDGVRFSKI